MSTESGATPSLPIEEPVPGYRDMTWEQAKGQRELCANLNHMPAGLTFPPDFPEPIHFDAEHKQLRYRGMMYHGSYAYLRDLSRDLHYLRAVDELYQLSATPPRHLRLGPIASMLGAGIAVAAIFSVWRVMH